MTASLRAFATFSENFHIKLDSQDLLRISDKKFHFLLLVRYIFIAATISRYNQPLPTVICDAFPDLRHRLDVIYENSSGNTRVLAFLIHTQLYLYVVPMPNDMVTMGNIGRGVTIFGERLIRGFALVPIRIMKESRFDVMGGSLMVNPGHVNLRDVKVLLQFLMWLARDSSQGCNVNTYATLSVEAPNPRLIKGNASSYRN